MISRHSVGALLAGVGLAFVLALPAWGAGNGAGSNGGVVRATLDNGLRVIIVRNTLAPVVTTEINYKVGSNEAPKGFPGMAHAQEHMMFRGSPGLSAGQLADISASMGGNFDADTQQTVTQYFYTVPAEDLDVALHIGALRMAGVDDAQADWSKERGAIEQEVARDLSNPQYVMYTRMLKALFAGTPYAHDALGTRPSFDKTTGKMLKRFHDTWYAPNNAILVVVGNVQPDHVLKEVKRLYGHIQRRKLPRRPSVKLSPVKAQTLHMKTDSPYGLVAVAFRLPGYDSRDYAASEVLSDVLSSQRGRLYDLVPAGKALDAGFELQTFPETGLGMAYAIFPRGADSGALLKALKARLHQVLSKGVPADLVAAAKRQEKSAFAFQKTSISGLASTWSQAVAVEGRKDPAQDMSAIEQVSTKDVNRVAGRYLDLDHAVAAVLTPSASGKPVASKGFGGKESFAPGKTKPVKLPPWAAKALHRLKVPESVVNPTVYTLDNGLKVIVQPETASDTVSVYGHVRNQPGLEAPKGQYGVHKVLGQLFDYGTTHLDRMAFQKALDDIGANESAGTDFSLQVLRNHFDRGMELLADNELHPALPGHALKIVRRQSARAVAGELQSPDFLMHHSLRVALFPAGDPSRREPKPKAVAGLTRKEVLAYYHKVFRPDLTTVVVIGDVDPAHARKVVARYFGGWKKPSTPKPPTVLPTVPDNKRATVHVPDASRVQDRAILAESLRITRKDPDYYALELGNHVLGGGFYATRLYQDLRQRSGLVYTVGSQFEFGRKRSVYFAMYACDPGNVSKARSIIQRDLQAMRKQPVKPEELHQAKALLLREIPLNESSYQAVAHG
ncbi:MAG TPA: pitrilysin family protein, partial [Gammaproteobacteria bacterium]|nr:pitrilysin family protein [Gammaproteobacteria bacterium]